MYIFCKKSVDCCLFSLHCYAIKDFMLILDDKICRGFDDLPFGIHLASLSINGFQKHVWEKQNSQW